MEWLLAADSRRAPDRRGRADAEALFDVLTGEDGEGWVTLEWLALNYLGRTREAAELLRPLDEAGHLLELGHIMVYSYFDPGPFPNLNAVLRRQGIRRESPPLPPCAWPPPS